MRKIFTLCLVALMSVGAWAADASLPQGTTLYFCMNDGTGSWAVDDATFTINFFKNAECNTASAVRIGSSDYYYAVVPAAADGATSFQILRKNAEGNTQWNYSAAQSAISRTSNAQNCLTITNRDNNCQLAWSVYNPFTMQSNWDSNWGHWTTLTNTSENMNVFSATFRMNAGNNHEFVLREVDGGNWIKWNTANVDKTGTDGIDLRWNNNNDFPNITFTLTETSDVTITLTYRPGQNLLLNVEAGPAAIEPVLGDGSKYYGYFEEGNATYSFGLAYCFTWESNGQVSCATNLMDKAARPDGFVYELWNYTTGATFNSFAHQGDNTYTATVSEGPHAKDANLNLGFRVVWTGGGSVYPGSHVIYTVGSEANTYSRPVASGEFYTLCLPFNAEISGGELFTVSSVNGTTVNLTSAGTDAVAGTPYIVKTSATTLTATYTAVAAFASTSANNMVGNLSADPMDVPNGKYVIGADNALHPVNGTVTVPQYCAYIDLSSLLGGSAPARLEFVIEGSNPVATGIENATAAKVTKALVDGKIVIVRGNQMFNLNGQLVK